MAKPCSVEDIIEFIEEHVRTEELPFPIKRCKYDTVDAALRQLHSNGQFLDMDVYDLRGTVNLWRSNGDVNFELARRAIKRFVEDLQEKGRLEDLLPNLSQRQFHKPFNKYGTNLRGPLSVYSGSPYKALKDLFDSDDDFADFRDFQPYDLHSAPKNTWKNKGSMNYKLARQAAKQLIQRLVERKRELKGSLSVRDAMLKVLPEISSGTFRNTEINKYGTTLENMLSIVFRNSPYRVIRNLIENDEKFKEFDDFREYDLCFGVQNLWTNKNGAGNKILARKLTKMLVAKLGENKTMLEVFSSIDQNAFEEVPINRYGTTLGSMLAHVYAASPFEAVRDLIENDKKFSKYSDFMPYDLNKAPNEIWIRADGTKNFELARAAVKQFFDWNCKFSTPAELLESISARDLFETPINRYGTCFNVVFRVYGNSPYRALKDFAEHDEKYAFLLPVIEKLKHSA